METLNIKVFKNALILEKLVRLDIKERRDVLVELLKNKSQRALAKELGIPYATLHDWKTLRQNNTGKNIHVSLALIHRKLQNMKPKDITDWGRIEMIKECCDELLRQRK